MDFDWKPVAMVRLTAFLLSGICAAYLTGFPEESPAPIPAAAIVSWASLLAGFITARQFRKRYIAGAIGLSGLAITGFLLALMHDDRRSAGHLANLSGPVTACQAELLEEPQQNGSRFRTLVRISAVRTPTGWRPAHAKIHLFTDHIPPGSPGNSILFEGEPMPLRMGASVNAPAYMQKLRRQNIFHTCHPEGDIRLVSGYSGIGSRIRYALAQARRYCIVRIGTFVSGERENAVLQALVLGITDRIDEDQNATYAATGTLHVLAVSGLHISLIYGLMLLFLSPATRLAKARWWVAVSCIVALWGYAALTAFSPSVLRAVAMFSITAIARPWGRRVNTWNIMASSVFLLVVADPAIITRLGFQLSYLAVAGIVWLEPWLERIWNPKNRILSWIHTTTCVSIAAQIATLPVSLMRFGMFPVFFIPANLLIIPISNVALIAGLALVALGQIIPVGLLCGWIAQNAIRLMNSVAEFFEHLPGSTITGEPLTQDTGIFLLLSFICAGAFLVHRARIAFTIWSLSALVFLSGKSWQYFKDQRHFDLIANHAGSAPMVTIRAGHRVLRILRNPSEAGAAATESTQPDTAHAADTLRIPIRSGESIGIRFGDRRIVVRNGESLPASVLESDWLINGPDTPARDTIRIDAPVVVDLGFSGNDGIGERHYTRKIGAYRMSGNLFGPLETTSVNLKPL